MNAYAKFRSYNKDFYTEAFAQFVRGDGTTAFDRPLRAHSQVEELRDGRVRYKRTLEDVKAMYLYGGRRALIRAFVAFDNTYGGIVLTPENGKYLAVFHGKVTVAKLKTKRILMIASFSTTKKPPTYLSD